MINRNTARAVIVSISDGTVLLINMKVEGGRPLWITPGGNVEEGESLEDAVFRELQEECGFQGQAVAKLIWVATNSFIFKGEHYLDNESYFLVEVPKFAPTEVGNVCEAEREAFIGFKWWKVAEIVESDEEFQPKNLGELLKEIQRVGAPTSTINISIVREE